MRCVLRSQNRDLGQITTSHQTHHSDSSTAERKREKRRRDTGQSQSRLQKVQIRVERQRFNLTLSESAPLLCLSPVSTDMFYFILFLASTFFIRFEEKHCILSFRSLNFWSFCLLGYIFSQKYINIKLSSHPTYCNYEFILDLFL